MAGLALDVLRVGKKYKLVNYGESYEFEVESILANRDLMVKDLFTLERFNLKDLYKFGKGKDFEIRELFELI